MIKLKDLLKEDKEEKSLADQVADFFKKNLKKLEGFVEDSDWDSFYDLGFDKFPEANQSHIAQFMNNEAMKQDWFETDISDYRQTEKELEVMAAGTKQQQKGIKMGEYDKKQKLPKASPTDLSFPIKESKKKVDEATGFRSGKQFINIKLQKYPEALAKVNQLIDIIGEDKFTMEMAEWVWDFFNNVGFEQPMNEDQLEEAEYHGRTVKLGKPFYTPGGPRKRAVYVKNDKDNVVKVGFGDPNMRIKKSNPARRKSFRARHNCDNPGPRWKARYWSCKAW